MQHLRLVEVVLKLVCVDAGEAAGRLQVQQGPSSMTGQLAVIYGGSCLEPGHPCCMPACHKTEIHVKLIDGSGRWMLLAGRWMLLAVTRFRGANLELLSTTLILSSPTNKDGSSAVCCNKYNRSSLLFLLVLVGDNNSFNSGMRCATAMWTIKPQCLHASG